MGATSDSAAVTSNTVRDWDFTITSPSTLALAINALTSDETVQFNGYPDRICDRAAKALADYAFYTEESPSGNQQEVIDAGAVPVLAALIKEKNADDATKKAAHVALSAIVWLNPVGQAQSHVTIEPIIRNIQELWKRMEEKKNNPKNHRFGRLCAALVALCIVLDSDAENQQAARDTKVIPLLNKIHRGVEDAFIKFCAAKKKPDTLTWDNFKTSEEESDVRALHQVNCTVRMLQNLLVFGQSTGNDRNTEVGMLRVTQDENTEVIECVRCSRDLLQQWDTSAHHSKARRGSATHIEWLKTNGIGDQLSVNTVDFYPMHPSDRKDTPVCAAQLLWAVMNTNVGMISFLMAKGTRIETIDKSKTPALCIPQKRVVAKFLLQRGADIRAINGFGHTPLHVAVRNEGNVKLIRALIREGAELDAEDREGVTALQFLVTRRHSGIKDAYDPVTKERYKSARILCSKGATWNYDAYVKSSKVDLTRRNGRSEHSRLVRWRLGLGVCVKHWIDQHKASVPLTEVDMNIIVMGADAVEKHFKEEEKMQQRQQIHRHKVCVVGDSGSGKTSLVTSLHWEEESRAKHSVRSIGIHLTELSFSTTSPESIKHEVTFWDFSGQDIYQSVHSPFFTQDTLYLLCVDLQAFYNEYKKLPENDRTPSIRIFVDKHVCSWARLVLLRQPKAKFQLVCTKADTLAGEEIETAQNALCVYMSIWTEKWMNELMNANDQDLSVLESTLKRLKKNAFIKPLLTSCATDSRVKEARKAIENIITTHTTTQDLESSDIYTCALKKIREIRMEAITIKDLGKSVKHVVMHPEEFKVQMTKDIPQLADSATYHKTITALHEQGDIMTHGLEPQFVVLDPMIVLNLTREIVSHTYKDTQGQDYDLLLSTGELKHSLLITFPTWSKLNGDRDMLLFFKKLLQRSNLAYPVGSDEMDSNSSLMVPTYWNIGCADAPEHSFTGPNIIRWQYEVSTTMFFIVITRFAVLSHTPWHIREFSPSHSYIRICDSDKSEFEACITFTRTTNGLNGVILIEVAADDETKGWANMRYFVMSMEAVLMAYPCLFVSRFILHGDDRTLYQVNEAVKLLKDTDTMDNDAMELQKKYPWVPLNFRWYREKAWTDEGKIAKIKTQQKVDKIDRQVEVLKKLLVTGDKRRRFPAVYSAKYSEDKKFVMLQFFSDLTGKCFHDPHRIELPSGILNQHAKWIEMAIPIFSIVVAAAISHKVVNAAVKQLAPGEFRVSVRFLGAHNTNKKPAATVNFSNRARRVQIADDLTRSLKLDDGEFTSDSCRPEEAYDLIQKLLKFDDDNYDPDTITRISNLECVADMGTGAYLWVHPSELHGMAKHLQKCSPDTLKEEFHAKRNAEVLFFVQIKVELRDAKPRVMPWAKPYCELNLYYDKDTKPLLSRSSEEDEKPDMPKWDDPWLLNQIQSLRELRKCRLVIAIYRPKSWAKGDHELSNGTVEFSDKIDEDHVYTDQIEFCDEKTIPTSKGTAISFSVIITQKDTPSPEKP